MNSMDTIIRQAIKKDTYLKYSRTGESAVKWMQSLHDLDQQDLPTWPLLTPLKVQKCNKCPLEFCSNINQKRHNRVDHGGRMNAKPSLDRSKIRDFWDKLTLDEAKKTVDIKNANLEGVLGSAIIESLSPLVQKEGLTLPHPLMKAGSSLLDIVQGKFNEQISSMELLRILDDASEKTFLHGEAESVQKYVFNVEAWKNDYKKNVVTSVACTSFLVEQKLVEAFNDYAKLVADEIAKLLIKEEEKEKRNPKEKKSKKKAKTKTTDPSDVQRSDRDADVAAEAPSGSGNGNTEAGIVQNVEGGTSLVTSEPIVPQVQREVEENVEMGSTVDMPKVGPPAETPIPGDVFDSDSQPDHVPAKVPLASDYFAPTEPGVAQNVEGGTLLASGGQGVGSRSQARRRSRRRRGSEPRQPLPVMNEGKASSSMGDQIGRKEFNADVIVGKGKGQLPISECSRVEDTSKFQQEGSSVVSSSSVAITALATRWKEATESNGYVKLVLPSDSDPELRDDSERVAVFFQKLYDAVDSQISSNAGC